MYAPHICVLSQDMQILSSLFAPSFFTVTLSLICAFCIHMQRICMLTFYYFHAIYFTYWAQILGFLFLVLLDKKKYVANNSAVMSWL